MNVRQTISSEFWKQYGNVAKFARESILGRRTEKNPMGRGEERWMI